MYTHNVHMQYVADTYITHIHTYIHSYQGQIYDFLREGAKPSSGSLKQGVWGAQPPEAIGYLVFEVSKSEVQSTFNGFLIKCMYY